VLILHENKQTPLFNHHSQENTHIGVAGISCEDGNETRARN